MNQISNTNVGTLPVANVVDWSKNSYDINNVKIKDQYPDENDENEETI
jgi:hypothetical protein